MCDICEGRPLDFDSLQSEIRCLRRQVNGPETLLQNATKADEMRFNTGSEWGELTIYRSVTERIFHNPDPDNGLLLFVLSCWLNMQLAYTTIWTTYLSKAKSWIEHDAWQKPPRNTPKGRFPRLVQPHLEKTVYTLDTGSYARSLGSWLVQAVLGIVQEHGAAPGNLYRFVGKVCADLYEPAASASRFVGFMRQGRLPTSFRGTHYKRLAMLVMFLRRDQSLIKCLLTRALLAQPHGDDALRYWYDPAYFDPTESELPVDSNVVNNWSALGIPGLGASSPTIVAMQARRLARKHNLPPSVFDAILFY